MTFHFQDEVRVNTLTIDETDPRSGTAEFKACAVRIDPIRSAGAVGSGVDAARSGG
jgi:anaerobic selenocysteine-containing dehydrogenase